ncbi:MAG: UdgX family uracil-DNA binding protein [Nitrospira sp.]|nr:UdgX family uracil-DNA binding protein [Nitrospira sp.]
MRRLVQSAARFIPVKLTIPRLQRAASTCTGCDLYQRATQTMFGERSTHATIMFVGEQPGDQEDRAGHPFVGPAGKILDKALAEAGIERESVYVTNAVKHFKWEPQGKRRKHKKPSASEIAACRPWLEAEEQAVKSQVIACLGVTAAQSAFKKTIHLNDLRGRPWSTPIASNVFVTVHPSAILRHPETAQRAEEYHRFVEDLKRIKQFLQAQAA